MTVGFIVGWLLVGAFFALIIFSISVISMPMILDRETDAITAGLTSLRLMAVEADVLAGVQVLLAEFERLKDEMKAGRSLRNSAQRGFSAAWRTILAADFVSLLGAVVLWYLSVGSVRGFALFLGLSTLLDLILSYFVMHPLVSLMARRRGLVTMRGVGIGAGLDTPEVEA